MITGKQIDDAFNASMLGLTKRIELNSEMNKENPRPVFRIEYDNLEKRILDEALEELRKKVAEENITNFLVCIGNKGYFNFN